MEHGSDLPIGKRIQLLRKTRGLSQSAFAMRVGRSASWVTKIERGERQIDSVSMLIRVAEALGVELHQVTGRPYLPAPVSPDSEQWQGLRPLRRALMRYDAFADTTESGPEPVRSVDELRLQARHLRRLYNTSPYNFSAVLPLLAPIIREAQIATRTLQGPVQSDAFAVLSNLYRLANLELRQYGDLDLAWIAADRSLLAAQQTRNRLLIAASAATMTVQTMIQGHPAEAVRLATAAVATLTDDLVERRGPALVVSGALHLYAAQAAARAEDPTESFAHLKAATGAAEELRVDREDYSLFFGPTNVGIQETGILVDLTDPIAALRRARDVKPEKLPSVNRQAYYHLHRSRAHVLRRQDREAVESILAAERVAPEQVQWDPMAREAVRAMLDRERRVLNPHLRQLAERLTLDT